MALVNFTPDCDSLNVGGVEVDVYYTCVDELAADPKSTAEVKKMMTPAQVPAVGDENRIGENYSFAGAGAGKGYWRKMTVISDTGMIETNGTRKEDTVKIENNFKFKLKGFGAVEKEFAERVAACCGMSYIIVDKNGVAHELGRKSAPATLNTFKGGTGGDFRGFEYDIMQNGKTPRTLDLLAYPLDTIPN